MSDSSWFEVVAFLPDPIVVPNDEARARMAATKLAWKVRDRKTGIVMLLVAPGEFMMGSTATERMVAVQSVPQEQREQYAEAVKSESRRLVTIARPFYLSETEVSQEAWQNVMGANPSHFVEAQNPVEQVSWDDCQRFCKLSGLRLPSETEWEYACRAGTTTLFSFGSTITHQQANHAATQPVACGSLPANPWGFREMHGNVWEWCEDSYQAEASRTHDAVKGHSSDRVLRGGGWYAGIQSLRCANRGFGAPGFTNLSVGLRVARDPS
jgi:formylglycine-generating enzyme required for sulfatase activity